jgi:hypothetical protein
LAEARGLLTPENRAAAWRKYDEKLMAETNVRPPCELHAILEFLFGCDADVAQHGAGELGKETLDEVEP